MFGCEFRIFYGWFNVFIIENSVKWYFHSLLCLSYGFSHNLFYSDAIFLTLINHLTNIQFLGKKESCAKEKKAVTIHVKEPAEPFLKEAEGSSVLWGRKR